MDQALLPLPGYGEQNSLPGLGIGGYRQPPLMSLMNDEPTPPGPPVLPGQLVLGAPEQPELTEASPPPVQLSLLPDPPPWELDPGPAPAALKGGRLSRRRARTGVTPGQTQLF